MRGREKGASFSLFLVRKDVHALQGVMSAKEAWKGLICDEDVISQEVKVKAKNGGGEALFACFYRWVVAAHGQDDLVCEECLGECTQRNDQGQARQKDRRKGARSRPQGETKCECSQLTCNMSKHRTSACGSTVQIRCFNSEWPFNRS